jgi:chromosome segregation ATPase
MPADDISHLDLTPTLAKFYRTQIHNLQKTRTTTLEANLQTLALQTAERTRLHRTIRALEAEVDASHADIEDLREALVRERKAVIELVGENVKLRGSPTRLGREEGTFEGLGGGTSRHYESLVRSLQRDHREYIERTRAQKMLLNERIAELRVKEERMQVALIEATREVVRIKTEREELAVRLEEVQCLMGERIGRLRLEIEGSSHVATKRENEELWSTVAELKVCSLVMGAHGRRNGWRCRVTRRKIVLPDLNGNSSVIENCTSRLGMCELIVVSMRENYP